MSAGHRFELENDMAVTPFVHPRLAVIWCSACAGDGGSASNISPGLEIGGSFEFNPNLSGRASILFGSSSVRFGISDVFGIAVTWTPSTVGQSRR
jgi:hypothetical protein